MSKVTDVPHSFIDGSSLRPEDLNRNLQHIDETHRDIKERRWVHFSASLPLQRGQIDGYGYDQDTNEEVRTYRVQFPETVILTSAQLRWYGTGDDTVRVELVGEGDGYYPSASETFLSITPSDALGSATDTQNSLITLAGGRVYRFILKGDGNFNSRNSWLDLRFRMDRYEDSSAGTYTPTLYQSGDTPDPSVLDSELDSINTAITASASPTTFTRAVCQVAHDFTSADADERNTWPLPRTDSDEDTQQVTSQFIVATRGDNGATGSLNIRHIVRDEGGSQLTSITAGMTTIETLQTNTSTTDIDLDDAAASPTTIADDYSAQLLSITGSNTDICAKAYVWSFYQ